MKGRASRSEYWWWALFTVIVQLPGVLIILLNLNENTGLTAMTVGIVISVVVSLALLIPNITVQVRRLHDINFSGGWWWLHLVGGIGSFILFIFALLPSVKEGNRFN
jgi:uncharacterized membrane protein YhaH (DUF805 family)